MPQIVAGILALTGLSASILAGHDPVSSLMTGGVAGATGWFLGGIWQSIVNFLLRRADLTVTEDKDDAETETLVEETEQPEAKVEEIKAEVAKVEEPMVEPEMKAGGVEETEEMPRAA